MEKIADKKVYSTTFAFGRTMSTKLLLTIAILFFISWQKTTDGFLLFCALFASGLFVCVFLHRMENPRSIVDKDDA